MTDLADANARRRILTEFGATFFVEAAAGTGKTTALVGRIVGLIRSGRGTLARIVAVTFTEKAAGEMKLRLRIEIEKAQSNATPEERDPARPRARRTGACPHRHDPRLLRRSSSASGPSRPASIRSSQCSRRRGRAALADQAFERWLQRILARPARGSTAHPAAAVGLRSPQEQLRSCVQTLREHRDFPRPWRRDPFDRNGAIDTLMRGLAEVGGLGARAPGRMIRSRAI